MAKNVYESTFESGGVGPAGSAGIKRGGELDTPMKSPNTAIPPLAGSNAINDRNISPDFNAPRSSGGIPVKFYEDVDATAAPLESTMTSEGLVRNKTVNSRGV